MSAAKFSKDEVIRINKIADALGWRFSVGVKEHFQNAGKMPDFVNANSQADIDEQKAVLKGLLRKSLFEATLATLKATDIFAGVARRVGNDNDLGKLLPAGKLKATDADLLDKAQMPSLAAIVRAMP